MKLDVKFSEKDMSVASRFSEMQTIHGRDGEDGKSAYEIAVDNGFKGSETEWLNSLHGKDGSNGEDGYTPVRGTDYWTEADKTEIVKQLSETITEEWTFTLVDGSTVTKKVAIGE